MEFHYIKQDGRLTLSTTQREQRERFISSLKEGVLIRETLQKAEVSKTHAQIKAIFGLAMALILDEFENRGWDSSIILGGDVPTGVPVSKVLLKEYLYVVCSICDDEGNKKSLGRANIEQASKFFEDIRNWSASKWQIVIPDPDPEWRKKQQPTPLFEETKQ